MIIWDCLVELMWSIMQARVVDLPLPAGPVINTIPFFKSERLCRVLIISGEKFKSSAFGISKLITRITAEREPLCLYALIRKRAMPLIAKEKSSSPLVLSFSIFLFPASSYICSIIAAVSEGIILSSLSE